MKGASETRATVGTSSPPGDSVTSAICQYCHVFCGIQVTVRGGRAVKVIGDVADPLFKGYTCSKGRSLPEQMYHADRLLHPQKRAPDGRFEQVGVDSALDEISSRIADLLGTHGPRSIATYNGTYATFHPEVEEMTAAFMKAIDSPMRFHAATIDQPGRQIAASVHGRWHAGRYDFTESDLVVLIGTNPLVSNLGGLPPADPRRWLRQARSRDLRLVVIDPRRTETAKQAELHVQPRPGTDVWVLAGIARILLANDLIDHEFVQANVAGLDALGTAVAPYSPDAVAAHTGVPASQLHALAEMLAGARRAYIRGGTGLNMASHPTLAEYLILVLHSLTGQWRRAGERVTNLPVFTRDRELVAEPRFHGPGWGFGEKLRVRNLTQTSAGLPTAAAADEMLLDGPERVRALIVIGGNPVTAWPDEERTVRALRGLDLLVTLDPRMTTTGRLSHFVLPPPIALERPAFTYSTDAVLAAGIGMGYPIPYARYARAVCDRPDGAELVEEWAVLVGIADRLGLPLRFAGHDLDLRTQLTSEALMALIAQRARVPLAEVQSQPHGGTWPGYQVVQPKSNDLTLDIGHPDMMAELRSVADEGGSFPEDLRFAHRLISRRTAEVYNSVGHDTPPMQTKRSFNPVFMCPQDLVALGLHSGDDVVITSRSASTVAVCERDDDLPPGVVSMSHGWGGPVNLDGGERAGTSVAKLIDVEVGHDPYSGIPVMSGVPVAIEPLGDPHDDRGTA